MLPSLGKIRISSHDQFHTRWERSLRFEKFHTDEVLMTYNLKQLSYEIAWTMVWYLADDAEGRVGKIRWYSARLSRIIVLLFNKLSMGLDKLWLCNLKLCSALQDVRQVFLLIQIWQTTFSADQNICPLLMTDNKGWLVENDNRITANQRLHIVRRRQWSLAQGLKWAGDEMRVFTRPLNFALQGTFFLQTCWSWSIYC